LPNCAYYNAPLIALDACFQPYTFSHNAVIASSANFPPSKYPFGNYFPPTAAAVDFVNYNGGDYHLQSNSPYKNAGTDGKDLGGRCRCPEVGDCRHQIEAVPRLRILRGTLSRDPSYLAQVLTLLDKRMKWGRRIPPKLSG
jgi:hypothetical protein